MKLNLGKNKKLQNKDDYEFLPVALEVIETPPSPLGRVLLWVLITMILIALIWAILGKVDEVAVTEGKVIPSGYTKIIQAEDKGIVKAILVHNGQAVKKGDILIELDALINAADLASLKHEADFQSLQLMRFLAERDGKPFTSKEGEYNAEEVENQRLLYETRTREHNAQIIAYEQGTLQLQASLRHTAVLISKAKQQLVIVNDQSKRVKQLLDKDLISLFEAQRYQQENINYKQDLSALKEEETRIRYQIAENKSRLEQYRGEWMREIASGIVESRRQLSQVNEELKKAQERVRLSTISSPIDGTVEQMAIHTVGAILTPAQPLMWVVPKSNILEIEAWASNRDIGYIRQGQSAEIKVETFNFQKFGTMPGIVKSVATEATEDERKGLIYKIILVSSQDHFVHGDQKAYLRPGMAVTGEIQIRKKRIIEYFLDPFKTYMSEGLRER